MKRRRARREESRFIKKPLGVVRTIVQTGHILVDPVEHVKSQPPRSRLSVVDETGSEIGYVSDVIGKVDSPLVVVRTRDRSLLNNIKIGARLMVLLPIKKRSRARVKQARDKRTPRKPSSVKKPRRGKQGFKQPSQGRPKR